MGCSYSSGMALLAVFSVLEGCSKYGNDKIFKAIDSLWDVLLAFPLLI